MSYLLLPADEMALIRHLCDELELVPLRSDLADRGAPRVETDPLAVVAGVVPSQLSQTRTLLFWCKALGPVQTMADAIEPTDAVDRVTGFLMRQTAGGRYDHVIDLARTPVIRWRRPCRQTERCLVPGLLQAMPVKVREHPPELLKLYRQIERWLKKRGEKLNPFEY